MGITFSQVFPPAPSLTESNLPDQTGKVFIVTGATSGVGFELSRILYHAGGKVYITARTEDKAKEAITKLKSTPSQSPRKSAGSLHYLVLDLADLTTIKPAVESFLASENHLNVLFNNAGISLLNKTYLTSQNHEAHMATNCLGPFLFTTLLLPALNAAAAASPKYTTRVVWTSSIVVDLSGPRNGFRASTALPPAVPANISDKVNVPYTLSKLANWYLASEFAYRHGGGHSPQTGTNTIISLTQNPGNLKTSLLRYSSPWIPWLVSPILYHARYGAYTELWTGLSDEISAAAAAEADKPSDPATKAKARSQGAFSNGGYVVPWGRIHPAPRPDLLTGLDHRADTAHPGAEAEQKEKGKAAEFWDWCEERVKMYR